MTDLRRGELEDEGGVARVGCTRYAAHLTFTIRLLWLTFTRAGHMFQISQRIDP